MSTGPDASTAAARVRDVVDFRRFPWIRPLVAAHAHDYASVAPLFAGDPGDVAAWHETIHRVQQVPRARDVVADAVAEQLVRRGAPPAARGAAALLRDPRTVAIVTGQQAGAFGGPLYTLLKAVTALQLARKVQHEQHVPVLALFWVDAEDHDWDEVRQLKVLDRDFGISDLSLAPIAGAGTQPAARLTFDERVDETIAALAQVLAPTEFTADLMTGLRRHYRPGHTLSRAFAGWLDELLGALGLVVFEADDPAAKAGVGDLFAKELAGTSVTVSHARQAADRMTALGHAPQVDATEDSVCLFYLDERGRRPIKRDGAGFTIGDERRTAADLIAEATAHPDRFSPNVLLRPLVQDRLFPTACYVAGPSELAYQAQLGGAYKAFGLEVPLLYSRASVTLLDSAAARFFDRHPVPIERLQAQDESVLNRLLEGQLPPDIDQVITESSRYFADQAARLKAAVPAVDPTLTGTVETTLSRIEESLKGLQAKIVQASKKKDETLRRQFARTRALTFPSGIPQERTLNLTFFVNRYGLALGERLLEVLPLDTGQHYVITL